MTLQVKYIFKLGSNPKTTFVAPLNFVQNLKIIFIGGPRIKVWRVVSMVISSEFRMEQYIDDDHREDAPQFNLLLR